MLRTLLFSHSKTAYDSSSVPLLLHNVYDLSAFRISYLYMHNRRCLLCFSNTGICLQQIMDVPRLPCTNPHITKTFFRRFVSPYGHSHHSYLIDIRHIRNSTLLPTLPSFVHINFRFHMHVGISMEVFQDVTLSFHFSDIQFSGSYPTAVALLD